MHVLLLVEMPRVHKSARGVKLTCIVSSAHATAHRGSRIVLRKLHIHKIISASGSVAVPEIKTGGVEVNCTVSSKYVSIP